MDNQENKNNNQTVNSAIKNKVATKGLATAANAIVPGSGAVVKKTLKTPQGQEALNDIVSNKRANSMNPYNIINNPTINEEQISESTETKVDAEEKETNEISQNNDNNEKEEKQKSNANLKGAASKKIKDFIKKNPYVLAILAGILVFFIMTLGILVIIVAATSFGGGDDSSSSGSAVSGSTHTTESSNQLSGQSLGDYLIQKGSSIEQFNNEINASITQAGRGTRAGVVAAAASITSYLSEKYNIRLPYEWGGGHSQKIMLANGEWGSSLASPIYANARAYLYSGLDCSGFVSWAIYNGGYNFPISGSEDFLKYGTAHNMSSNFVAKPGDLIHHPGHIMIIIGVDESSKTYSVAEAAGGDEGMRVKKMPFKGYGTEQIIDMSDYYNNRANVGG